jgi:hypothetical protein
MAPAVSTKTRLPIKDRFAPVLAMDSPSETASNCLSQDVANHLAVHVGETEIATLEAVGQLEVIYTQ